MCPRPGGEKSTFSYVKRVWRLRTVISLSRRPITSYGALDLPTYYIDLTPFVPLLTDGSPHNVALDVVSAEANHTINDNWFVSGNIQVGAVPVATFKSPFDLFMQVLVDHSTNKTTTGKITRYDVPPFATTSVQGVPSANGDLRVTVQASRHLTIEADVTSGGGETTHVVWQQNLQYNNLQIYLQNASRQAGFIYKDQPTDTD
jgi:Peptide N-acetyl-beta-D-glucosaminyl asparaginase amidase A